MSVPKWLKSRWLWLGIVASIFVAAAVAFVLALVTHEEAGFMGVCEDGSEATQYLSTPTPECPRILWGRVPISVMAMTDNPHPVRDPEDAARSAIDAWNGWVGFELLRYDEEGPEHCMEAHSICLRIGEAREPGWMDTAGDARFFWGDDGVSEHPLLYCEARTSNTGTVELLGYVLEHEIGHCLGLAHDDYASSIMRDPDNYPFQHVPNGQFPPDISDFDRQLLRGLYHRSAPPR